jgi:hypothetical protein
LWKGRYGKMQIINYGELAGELVKYNTFTVDGQLCLGTVVTRNYEECGIPVLADLNHLKWIVNEWEIEHITKIEKDSSDNKCYYKPKSAKLKHKINCIVV